MTPLQLADIDKGYIAAFAALNGGVHLLDDPAEIRRVCAALVSAKDMNVNLRLENARLRAALRLCATAAQSAAEQEGP